jgi:protoheme IX farnesyltransferase
VDVVGLFHCLLGTGLLASGASALNQFLERDLDALMARTSDRPLPSGRLQPATVLVLGGVWAALGLLYLALLVSLLVAMLGAITLSLYLFAYTPLKRLSPVNTVVGAIPGALPPLMGWAAAHGAVTVGGWSLFALQFFWQLPHFLAIAWLYREEYARAGFRMLAVVDPTGERVALQSVSHTLGLVAVSLSPFVFGIAGVVYLGGVVAAGGLFLWCALRFARTLSRERARWLFLASIVYLPLVLGLIVWDKVR